MRTLLNIEAQKCIYRWNGTTQALTSNQLVVSVAVSLQDSYVQVSIYVKYFIYPCKECK